MRQLLHHIWHIILTAYVLSVFHVPVTSLMHILEHVIEATDFHHHHEHIHSANETDVHIHEHEHRAISFVETIFGEDKNEEDRESAISLDLEKHIIVHIPDLPTLYPELLLLSFGSRNYPLLTGHPLLIIPPPRTA